MNVLLIDTMGNARRMTAAPGQVTDGIRMPMPVSAFALTGRHEDRDRATCAYECVEFRDSGYVDSDECPILTVGGAPPRLDKSGTVGYKRGRQLYATVYVSELQLRETRMPPKELAWEAAQPILRDVAQGAQIAYAGVKIDKLHPSTLSTRFVVYAEERLPA